jgi:hypothetical protein
MAQNATQRREAMSEEKKPHIVIPETDNIITDDEVEKLEKEFAEKVKSLGCDIEKHIRFKILAELEREVEARVKDINKTLGAVDMETSIRRGGAEAELEWFSSLIRSKKGGA